MGKKSGCLVSQTFEDDILTLPFTNIIYITAIGKTTENHKN